MNSLLSFLAGILSTALLAPCVTVDVRANDVDGSDLAIQPKDDSDE